MIISASMSRLGVIVAACLISACDLVGVESNNDDNIAPGCTNGFASLQHRMERTYSCSGLHRLTATRRVIAYFGAISRRQLQRSQPLPIRTLLVVPATTYGYFVVAFDDAAPPNESGPTPVVQIRTPSAADTVAPAVPANVQAVASGPTQVNLTWDASADAGGSGLAGYRIFRNGGTAPIATVAIASYSDINLTAGTAYTYVVRAFDGAGNVSGPSNAVSITTPIPADTTPPTVARCAHGSRAGSGRGAPQLDCIHRCFGYSASTKSSATASKISGPVGNATSFC